MHRGSPRLRRGGLTVATIEESLLAAMGEHRGSAAADRLCESCVALLGIDAAAISLVFDGTNHGTLGASGAAARRYDEAQFTYGEGPCLDAVARRAPVVSVDLADPSEIRWPAYGPAMLANRIHGGCTPCRSWWRASSSAPWTSSRRTRSGWRPPAGGRRGGGRRTGADPDA